MPHPYKILNLQGYFSCKTIEKISRPWRKNFLYWVEGQLPPQAKSEMTPLPITILGVKFDIIKQIVLLIKTV